MKHTYTIDEIFDTLEIAISMSDGKIISSHTDLITVSKDGIHNSLTVAKREIKEILAEHGASITSQLREVIDEYRNL